MVTNNAINIPTGAASTILQGQGVGVSPAFSTATYPATATGTGKILRADGTNWAATTATFPTTAGTSGNVLTSDGTNWSSTAPVGGGASLYNFFVYPNATLTNVTGDATVYTIVFNTESFDTGSNFATSTFTAPVAGKYMFSSAVTFYQMTTAVTTCNVGIYVNGTEKLGVANTHSSTHQYNSVVLTGPLLLAINDLVTCRATAAGTTKTIGVLGSATTYSTFFSGYLLAT